MDRRETGEATVLDSEDADTSLGGEDPLSLSHPLPLDFLIPARELRIASTSIPIKTVLSSSIIYVLIVLIRI